MGYLQPSRCFLGPSPTSRFRNRAFRLSPNLGSLRRFSEDTSASLFRHSLPHPHSGKHLQAPFHQGQVFKFGPVMLSLPPAVTTNHFDSGPTSATSVLRFESSLSVLVITGSSQPFRDYYTDSATPLRRWPVWGPSHSRPNVPDLMVRSPPPTAGAAYLVTPCTVSLTAILGSPLQIGFRGGLPGT